MRKRIVLGIRTSQFAGFAALAVFAWGACVGSDPVTSGPSDDAGTGDASNGAPPTCGNGKKEIGEDCDGADLDGKRCADVGSFYAGALACTPACRLETSLCVGPPSVPALRKPMNNAHRSRFSADARRPTFEWEPSRLSGPLTEITYELQYGTDATFQEAVATATVKQPATTYVVTKDLAIDENVPVGSHHYWRVRACVGDVCSAYSRTWHLHVWRSEGDLDGDGYADLVVGAPSADGAGADSGRLVLYRGGPSFSASTTATPFEGAAVGAGLGGVVRHAGDVDGDGFADLLASSAAGISIYFGSATGPFSRAPHVLPHPAAYKNSVASAGDVNGDGFADIVIGKPGSKALLFFGGKTLKTTPDHELAPSSASPLFAKSAIGVGDLNGDGFGDLVFSGTYYGEANPVGGAPKPAAWVFFGAESGPPTFAGSVEYGLEEGSGYSAAGCDVDGDGFSDLVVGMSRASLADVLGGGRLYRGSAKTPFDFSSALPLQRPNGGVYGLGESVACGDVTGDGRADIILGSPYSANGGSDQGSFVLYPGSAQPTGVGVEYLGATNDWLGIAVAVPGDLDGDGLGDVAATAPGYSWYTSGQNRTGKALVYFGRTTLPLVSGPTFPGVQNEHFGAAVGP